MIIEGEVGPQFLTDGTNQPIRQGRLGDAIVSELHGRYYEASFRRNLFTAYAQGVTATSAQTALVGLQLWNGSTGFNLVLLKVWANIFVTSASVTRLILATGTGQVSAPTAQTAITRVSNNYIGGAAPNATATNAGTFTNAPTALIPIMHNTAAIATTGEDQGAYLDLEGSIIIPPQAYAALCTVGGSSGASGADFALMWEEVST